MAAAAVVVVAAAMVVAAAVVVVRNKSLKIKEAVLGFCMRPRISVCPSARWSIRWSIRRSVCQSVRNPFFFKIAKTRVPTSVGERKARGRQGEGKREVEGGGGGMEGSGGGAEGVGQGGERTF